MMTSLKVFHNRISRHIVVMVEKKGDGGGWEWAFVEADLEVKGVLPISYYVRRRQTKITECVVGRLI